MVEIVRINVGDVVKLKKAHPCGVNAWEVTKLGMDIGLSCRGCGRKVRLARYDFDRRFRSFIERAEEHEAEAFSGEELALDEDITTIDTDNP